MNTTTSSHSQLSPDTTSKSGHVRAQIDATGRLPVSGERALVLGGGGSTGNAWLIGIIAGLSDAGLDLTNADLTIGTSAGSTVAAQLVGAAPGELLAAILSTPSQPPTGRGSTDQGRAPRRSMTDHLEAFKKIIAESDDAADMRRRMGEAALGIDAAADDSWQAQWRATVESRLPGQHWPERTVLITAVDARTGEPTMFDRHSGIDLVDAVAASCAGGAFAYKVGEGRYIDGGYRSSSENADLAAGYKRVLVLSPLSGRSLYPKEWGVDLTAQVDQLRAGGSKAETIFPSSESEHLFVNPMNFWMRPPAAQSGYEQGQALAEQIAEFWR